MMEAKIDLNMDELRLVKYALVNCENLSVPMNLLDAIDSEIEKIELLDMSDWNDCGDACKL